MDRAEEATQPEECQSCGYETHLKPYENGMPRQTYWLCELCAGTLAGNAVAYPGQYGEAGTVMKTICYVGNAILEAIRSL
jgi:ribosomal protein L37AE/L43A